MKKQLLAVVAASSMMLAACGGSSNNATTNNSETKTATENTCCNEAIVPVDASAKLDNTFEHEKFTVSYPSSLKPQEQLGSDVYIVDNSGLVVISGTYNTEGATLDQLKELAENMAAATKAAGDIPEAPIVKGKSYVIKCDAGTLTKWNYCVMKEDKIGLMGSIEYPKDEAAEYEKYVGAILQSIKFK